MLRPSGHNLIVESLRVARLGEKVPALRQQSKVLHQHRRDQPGSGCAGIPGFFMVNGKLNLDLHLLKVFVTIYRLRSVSDAAHELDCSQSGLSTALSRLRLQFQDPLFTKSSTGMEPTTRARELLGPAERVIRSIETELLATSDFVPATSAREFSIALSDIGEGIYLPGVIRSIYSLAPNLRLKSLYMASRQLQEAMSDGVVDMAAGYFPDITSNQFHMRRIGLHSFTCIARADHPVARTQLTHAKFAELGHVVVEPPGRSQEVFEHFLKVNRMHRRVVLRTPHFMSVPVILAETDTIAVVPQAVSDFVTKHGDLREIKLPFLPPIFQVNLYWHRSVHHDAGNKWMRDILIEQFPEIQRRRYDRKGRRGAKPA